MKMLESQESLVTVANAAELTSAIVMGVVGNELASGLQGAPLTRELMAGLFTTKVQQMFVNGNGGA